MNMRLLSLIFMLCNLSLAQELPDLIPPSPTAYQMTKYGDIPLNESTGKISPSIPLYIYNAGRLQLPISLDYQGNGVKVDQASGWTGINWNLNAGGVITHIIKGKDDFASQYTQQFKSYEEIYHQDLLDQDVVNDLNAFITNTGIDSQVDEFHFSFIGQTGGFYIDQDQNGHLYKYDRELLIEVGGPPVENNIIQPLKREIVIIDPQGIQYYFGGVGASEESKTSTVSGLRTTEYSQTAFFLNKIVHPLGDEIYFSYDDLSTEIVASKGANYTVVASKEMDCSMDDNSASLTGQDNVEVISISQTKVLKEITSNRSSLKIEFHYTVNTNQTLNTHYSHKLNSIEMIDTSVIPGEIEDRIVLGYIHPYNGQENDLVNAQRFFLKEVNFLDGRSYHMDYNHPESLPNRFSYDQDHLGFFNNKGNTSYFPETDVIHFVGVNNKADREPVFEEASKGVLEKIYYPTGGYTEFKYEGGISLEEDEDQTETIHDNFVTYYNDTTRSPTDLNPNFRAIGLQTLLGPVGSTVAEDNIVMDQSISIRLYNFFSTELLLDHGGPNIVLTVTDLTDNIEVFTNSGYNTNLYQEAEQEYKIDYGMVYTYPDIVYHNIDLNEGHQYKVSLEIIPHSTNANAIINCNVDYDYKIFSNEPPAPLGIRIKSIADYSNDTYQSDPVYKRFYYRGYEIPIMPQYISYSQYRQGCGSGNGYNHYYLATLGSDSFQTIYSNGQQYYSNVETSFGGDGFENGGTKKEFVVYEGAAPAYFTYSTDGQYSTFPKPRENRSVLNGTLKREEVLCLSTLNNGNQKPRVLKENEYYYSFDNSEFVTNNVRVKMYDAIYNPTSTLGHLALGIYNTYSHVVALDSTISRSYDYDKMVVYGDLDSDSDGLLNWEDMDDDNDGFIDIFDSDDDNNGILDEDEPQYIVPPGMIKQKASYEYNQYVGFPTKAIHSTSEMDRVHEIVTAYPENPSGFMSYLSTPLSVYTFVRDGDNETVTLSSISNQYSSIYSHYGENLKLLSNVMVRKGDPQYPLDIGETKIVYHDYDSHGNLLEVSKTDGIHIVYLWGYNQTRPIAKIENATYSEVEEALSSISSSVTTIQSLSDSDIDNCSESNCTEQQLRVALNNLRANLPNALVVTYTYDPLIGVTSITDPKGYTTYYKYDDFNRLEYVKDSEGKLLSQNKYHYKN